MEQSILDFFNDIYSQKSMRLISQRWTNIRQRCLNKKNPAYSSYGAKGITIDKTWLDKEVFIDWFCLELSAFAKDYDSVLDAITSLDIDRKDPFESYTPDNCQLLATSLNVHTTKFPRLMLPYANDLLPCWIIERIVGVKDISASIREDMLRGKGVLTDFELYAHRARYNYKKYGVDEVLSSVKRIIYYSFLKKPLKLHDQNTTYCPRCNVMKFHITENKPDLALFCDNCNYGVLLINGKNRKLDTKRHDNIPQTYHKPEHIDLALKYYNPYKTEPNERNELRLKFKEKQEYYKEQGRIRAEKNIKEACRLAGENEKKRQQEIASVIAPYIHWRNTKHKDLPLLKDFIESNKKTLPTEAYLMLKATAKRIKRFQSAMNARKRKTKK